MLGPQGSAPLILPSETPRTRRLLRGALLLAAPPTRRRAAFAPPRPVHRADTGRFWVSHLSRPIRVGRGRYDLLLSPRPLRVFGPETANVPRLPACLLSERGPTAWTPGDPLPSNARTVVPLPGFTVRVPVIEAAAFAAADAALPDGGLVRPRRRWVKTNVNPHQPE